MRPRGAARADQPAPAPRPLRPRGGGRGFSQWRAARLANRGGHHPTPGPWEEACLPGAWLPGASLTKLGACAAPPGPSRRPGWARTPTRACSWPGAHLFMTPPGLREGNAGLWAGRGLRGGEDLARLGRAFRFLGRFSPTSPPRPLSAGGCRAPRALGSLEAERLEVGTDRFRLAWLSACLSPPPSPPPPQLPPLSTFPPNLPPFLVQFPPAAHPSTCTRRRGPLSSLPCLQHHPPTTRTEIGLWGKVVGPRPFQRLPAEVRRQETSSLTNGGTSWGMRGQGLWKCAECAVTGRVLSCPAAWEDQSSGCALRRPHPAGFSQKVTRPCWARTSGNGGRGGRAQLPGADLLFRGAVGGGNPGPLPRSPQGTRARIYCPLHGAHRLPLTLQDSPGKSA